MPIKEKLVVEKKLGARKETLVQLIRKEHVKMLKSANRSTKRY
jgi:hypothetical protein